MSTDLSIVCVLDLLSWQRRKKECLPTALPPDVRRRLCPAVLLAIELLGLRPRGAAPINKTGLDGRAATSPQRAAKPLPMDRVSRGLRTLTL